MVGLYQTKFSVCLILLSMQIWTSKFTIQRHFSYTYLPKSIPGPGMSQSCSHNQHFLPNFLISCLVLIFSVVWGRVAHPLVSLSQRDTNMNVAEVRGDSEAPRQMERGLQGQRANMCDAAWPAWRLLTFHPRTPRRGIIRWNWTDLAAMLVQVCVWCLSVPASVVTWDAQATPNLSLSTYKRVVVNCWDPFISYSTNRTSDLNILLGFVLFSFGSKLKLSW